MEKDFLYVCELKEKKVLSWLAKFQGNVNFLVYQGNQLSQDPKLLFWYQ